MTRAAFSITGRMRSFGYAFSGLGFMLKTQHNAWLHLLASVLVVAAAIALRVDAEGWLWLIAAMALVWISETTNTAFEHLCDVVSPELNESVRRAKDVAAGAVLISAVAAVVIGFLIFRPYLHV